MNLNQLKEPFKENEIEWRIGSAGISNGRIWANVLAYVTNRAIMDRLDSVCGPENWKNEFIEWKGVNQLCGISIKINNEWVAKWDGAGDSEIESVKGGLSDAMKRAAVQWGIGRYLYELPVTNAKCYEVGSKKGDNKGSFRDKKNNNQLVFFEWDTPKLPSEFLPASQKPVIKPKNTFIIEPVASKAEIENNSSITKINGFKAEIENESYINKIQCLFLENELLTYSLNEQQLLYFRPILAGQIEYNDETIFNRDYKKLLEIIRSTK